MATQVGWNGLVERFKAEAPRYSQMLPQLPRLVHQALTQATQPHQQNAELLKHLIAEQKRTNFLLGIAIYFGGGLLGGIAVAQLILHWYSFRL
jgi:ubiquinone biosynthesis protein